MSNEKLNAQQAKGAVGGGAVVGVGVSGCGGYVLCICLHDSDFMHYITFGFQFEANQAAIYLNKKKI